MIDTGTPWSARGILRAAAERFGPDSRPAAIILTHGHFDHRDGATMSQAHVQRYLRPLLKRAEAGEINPSFIIAHKAKLDDGPATYKAFRGQEDGRMKVALKP